MNSPSAGYAGSSPSVSAAFKDAPRPQQFLASTDSVFRQSTLTFLAKILASLLALAATILLARNLGPEGQGLVALVLVVHAALLATGQLGMQYSNLYHVGKGIFSPERLFSNSLILTAATSILLPAALSLGEMFTSPKLLSSDTRLALNVALLVLFPGLVTDHIAGILQGLNRVSSLNLISVTKVGSLVLWIMAIVVLGGQGLPGGLAAFALAVVTTGLLALVCYRQIGSFRWDWRPETLRPTLTFGLQAWLTAIMVPLYLRIDTLFVKLFLDLRAVGFYYTAAIIAETVWLVPYAIVTALFGRFAARDRESAIRYVIDGSRHCTAASLLLSLLLLVAAPWAVPRLFGASYEVVYPPLFVLVPGLVSYGTAMVCGAFFTGFLGKPWINLVIVGVSLVFETLLCLFLIRPWGLLGAALASTLSYLLGLGVALYFFHRYTGVSPAELYRLNWGGIKEYPRRLWGIIRHPLET